MKKYRLISAALAAALALAGCTTGTESTTTSSTDSGDSASTTEKLRVGMECNYAPFNWTTTEESETTVAISDVDYADGYDVVIAAKLAEAVGREVEIVKTDWDALIPALKAGEIDCIIAGMTETEERALEVDFTSPYYISKEVVIVRKDSELANITNIQELSGYKVIGQMGTIYDDIIDQIEGVVHMDAATDFPAAINALQYGEVDAVTSELPVAVGVTSANDDLTYVEFDSENGFEGSETDASVSIAVAKDNTDLLDALQEALDNISEEEREEIMTTAVETQPASE